MKDTKLSQLGFGVSFDNADANGDETVILFNSSGVENVIKVNQNTTIDEFISDLNDAGLYASISNSGILEITGGEIVGGTFDAVNIFGLTQNTNSAMVVGNSLTTILSDPNNVDLQTRLVEDLGVTRGYFEITTAGGDNYYEKVYSGMTVADLMSSISNHGLNVNLDAKNGRISISGGTIRTLTEGEVVSLYNDVVIQESDENLLKATNLFSTSGYTTGNNTIDFNNVYTHNGIQAPQQIIGAVLNDTKLADIITGGDSYEAGLITVVKDNIQYNISLSADDTFGGLMETLSAYGFESVLNEQGQLIIQATGDSRLQNYTVNGDDASNILDILGINSSEWSLSNSYLSAPLEVKTIINDFADADENTLLSDVSRIVELDETGDISTSRALSSSAISNLNGNIELIIDGESNILNISSNETIGTLLDKFRSLGLEATITDGNLTIHSGYKSLAINTPSEGASSILSNNILTYNSDIGGYVSSTDSVISTTTDEESLSASAWASRSTALKDLNITTGTFSVFRDGMKSLVTIKNNETFQSLEDKINADFNSKYGAGFGDIELSFEHGCMVLKSSSGAVVSSGSSTDSSNISSIAGLVSSDDGYVKSSYELYKANIFSKVTQSGIFRAGDVTEGDFVVGNQTINVTSSTTVNDIISMINASEDSGAYAYWDDVYGKLAIKSTIAGATLVNIEAGTSNFTDIMGFTASERDGSNNILSTSLNTDAQVLGGNAIFTIDGTTYTANSNTVGGDVTRIQGLTINLKDVTVGEDAVITVNKDVKTVSNAMEDVVNAYNELMEAVDEAISTGGDLSDQTTLKMIRNQLKSYMTGSQSGATLYRNLDAIGACVDNASGSNISTSTSSIVKMKFDENKFENAFLANYQAVKYLLIGDSGNDGILTKIEDLVESALQGVSGYFDTQNASYTKQISTLNRQITKANQEISIYREQLEAKFGSMDILISNMQQQYQSFLNSSG